MFEAQGAWKHSCCGLRRWLGQQQTLDISDSPCGAGPRGQDLEFEAQVVMLGIEWDMLGPQTLGGASLYPEHHPEAFKHQGLGPE